MLHNKYNQMNQERTTLYGMSNVIDSVSQLVDNSKMMNSLVAYVAPEKRFRDKYPFEERYFESNRVLEKYPDRLPVIVERTVQNNSLPDDPKKKYLVPRAMRLGELLCVIRKRIKLQSHQAIFLYVSREDKHGNEHHFLAPINDQFEELYYKYKSKDNFLYLVAGGENVFGAGN